MHILEQTHPRGWFWISLSRAAKDAFLSTFYCYPTADDHNARYAPDPGKADEMRAFFG